MSFFSVSHPDFASILLKQLDVLPPPLSLTLMRLIPSRAASCPSSISLYRLYIALVIGEREKKSVKGVRRDKQVEEKQTMRRTKA